MESSQTAYVYKPLDKPTNIRILSLHPAVNISDPLHANLFTTDRADIFRFKGHPASYEAVSYCWGPIVLSHDLNCDSRVIQITSTVHTMLQHLRKREKPRFLWIDAICINQNDNEEKAYQVQLMGEVYQQAEKVHVWLGEGNSQDRLPEVFALFRALAVIEDIPPPSSSQSWERVRLVSRVDPVLLVRSDSILQEAVGRFLLRPWFQRRWILQEVALGHDVVIRCGSYKCTWTWIVGGINAIATNSFYGLVPKSQHKIALKQVLGLREGKGRILDLLWSFDSAQCSDSRDRLFALCGMAVDLIPFKPKDTNNLKNDVIVYPVDYSQDLSSTYTCFSRACIKAGMFYSLLRHVASFGSLTRIDHKTPTWVPDWSLPRSWEQRFNTTCSSKDESVCILEPVVGLETVLRLDCRLYGPMRLIAQTDETFASQLARFLKLFFRIGFQDQRCRAISLGYLCQILSAAVLDSHFALYRESDTATRVLSKAFEVTPSYFSGQHLLAFEDAYEKSLKEIAGEILVILEEWYARLNRPQYVMDRSFDLVSSAELASEITSSRVMSAVCELLADRKIFYAKKPMYGSLFPGIGPSNMQPGDFVFQPNDAAMCKPVTTAFVVRPWKSPLKTDVRKSFRLVGFCFLPEIDESVLPDFDSRRHRETILLV